MLRLNERIGGETRPIWIATWHVLYVVESISGGTDIRMRDDVVRSVTEKPYAIAEAISAMAGRD